MANSNVTVLNGRTATAVALVLFNFVSGAIQGSALLIVQVRSIYCDAYPNIL